MKILTKIKMMINVIFLYMCAIGFNIIVITSAISWYKDTPAANRSMFYMWAGLLCLMCFGGFGLGYIFSNRDKIKII